MLVKTVSLNEQLLLSHSLTNVSLKKEKKNSKCPPPQLKKLQTPIKSSKTFRGLSRRFHFYEVEVKKYILERN
jgi:hypothetical protein